MYGLSIDLADGSPPVLHVSGDLDMANAEEFATALKQALSADSTLVVDLAGLTFIDAAGLRVILHAAESRNGVGPLTLVNADRVAWLLEVVGMADLPSIDFAPGGGGHVG
jgi:anti-sigma B factor antagonist/stage II sporulation protein AA (anti-sigma F factor antagonist)